jgi:hypothetical protein
MNGRKRTGCRMSVRNPERNIPPGRQRLRRLDNIKIDLREIGWGGMK